MIPLWIFVIIFAYSMIVTAFCLYQNIFPFCDRGHRCFSVPNEAAAKAVVAIFNTTGYLEEKFTFDSGPTHQTLLRDNATVIIRLDPDFRKLGLATNAISVISSDPKESARRAADILHTHSFSANITENIIPEAGNKLVLLSSNAFEGWILIFRRHLLAMGKKPAMRRIINRKS